MHCLDCQFVSKSTNHAHARTDWLGIRLLLHRNLYARVMHFQVLFIFSVFWICESNNVTSIVNILAEIPLFYITHVNLISCQGLGLSNNEVKSLVYTTLQLFLAAWKVM